MQLSNSSSSSIGDEAPISSVHADVIGTHILTRLDGVSLSSFSCASSLFRSVANDQRLWRHVCTATWPSSVDTRVQSVIASFPGCHRGFFSDSFPLLTGHVTKQQNWGNPNRSSTRLTKELISAVDIHYNDQPVFSKVQVTETESGWFEHSPFRIDLLGPKESIRVGVELINFEQELSEKLKVNWIVIDPTRKISANLSSMRAVARERHWLTGDITVKYSTAISVERWQWAVEVEVKVTCRGKEVHLREVGMRVEDMEGKWMNGKGSLGCLLQAMEFGERKIDMDDGVRGKERYVEYLERKKVWRIDKERMERKMGISCIAVGVVAIIVGFCMAFYLSPNASIVTFQ